MKIVVCPDSFKGSLTAQEVASTIFSVLREEMPENDITLIPLADGGEGTAEIIKEKLFPVTNSTFTYDPIGREIKINYYTDKKGEKAFIESAKIIGLTLLNKEERDPFITSSYGLGVVIKEIVAKGYKEIIVSLGGSATCDGGEGMLNALEGIYINDLLFKIICDVKNPLLGDNGAVYVFAPQKGAKEEDLPILERRMKDFIKAKELIGLCEYSDSLKEGAGAAGGLGFAFQTLLKAETLNGIDFILEETNFEKEIENADIIITGEGKIDRQSLMGKVLSGVVKKAHTYNIPVVAIGGKVEDTDQLLKSGVNYIYEISDPNKSLEENMTKKIAKENLKRTIKDMLKNNIFKQRDE